MSFNVIRQSGFLAILLALALVAAPLAVAQQQPPQPPEDMEVTDAQLESFAQAYIEIEQIRETYEPSLENVQDPEQAQEIQREANMEMIAAIEDNGLTPEEYNQIAMVVSQDEELRNRAIEMIEGMQ